MYTCNKIISGGTLMRKKLSATLLKSVKLPQNLLLGMMVRLLGMGLSLHFLPSSPTDEFCCFWSFALYFLFWGISVIAEVGDKTKHHLPFFYSVTILLMDTGLGWYFLLLGHSIWGTFMIIIGVLLTVIRFSDYSNH